MRYRIYRRWQQFLHRHGWHHTIDSYPEGPNGVEHRVTCSWCGINGTVMDGPRLRRVADEMTAAAAQHN